ncbi:NAD-dependent epimerase [Rhizobiales bacterium TNE-4]|nr:NAD-dependent epimerase [Rhizobiales bacterium TNE-4]MBV1827578.1 NAD-dependent epimerase [Rhizobiales bacterium TNE-4]
MADTHDRPILVTGAAGFIGFHLANRLLDQGYRVTGFDNLNDYYDPRLKEARLAQLTQHQGFTFSKGDLADAQAMKTLFEEGGFHYVAHLAAQAGVRYSLINPAAYGQSNLTGFLNILEMSRQHGIDHLVYASSSSVYGANAKVPFSTEDSTDHPLSLYAATKKANEAMAHAYANMFELKSTGLRFFSVYGPWGRPDMAMWLFTDAILNGKPLRLFNKGHMKRDFTYVDDIVEAISRLIFLPAAPDPNWSAMQPKLSTSAVPHRIYNIGNHTPVAVDELVRLIEKETGKKAIIENAPMQPGDVYETFADVRALTAATGFEPHTPIEKGVRAFVDWYRTYIKS